jgi:hypothetical protein
LTVARMENAIMNQLLVMTPTLAPVTHALLVCVRTLKSTVMIEMPALKIPATRLQELV